MVSVYKITLDTQKSAYQAILDGCRRGDTGTRKVEIQLTHSGKPLRPPEGCIVTMWVTLPSGHVSYSTCGVESGVISHLFRTTELAEEGDALCEVRVTDENGSVLTSPRFKVRVDDTLQDDEAIESTNEYSALTEAMAGLEEKKEAAQAAAGRADSAAASADAAAQEADAAASGAMTAAAFANAAALEVRGQVANKPSAYVLLWSDNTQVDYREENEPVLQELCGLENGKYHVVLRDGNHEYPLLRREYTAEDGYFYYFGGENHELYTAGEYVIGYKPAFSSLDAAEYTVTRRSTVNGLELVEYDFRPPSTDLVKMCMDEHTGDTDIHVTAAEKAKWNAGTGGASYGEATASASGLMSKADKIKLDGIEEGADSVSFESARTNGTKVGELTINGTPTTLWAPMNTHYLSSTVVGSSASAQSNGAAANGNVHWNHVEDTVVRSSHKLVGSGAAKVTADSSGNITVHATDTTYGNATASAAGLMSGADKAKLDSVGKSYVLLWSDNTQVDYREENEPVLRELCGLENGKYHVVLRKGNHEYPMTRREYTAAKGYFYYFGGELSENYAAGEYVIGYKPGNSLESAVYTVTGNSTVNGLELAENDFRPPTTDLVKMCMDEHTGDTDIHITAAERAAWNAGTGGGEAVTYTLSKTGSTIKLTGSDGTSSSVTDANTTYGNATATAAGLMSAADKAKLDSHTGNTDIHITAAERAAWNAGTGGGTAYEEATTTQSGLMSASDKAKLDSVGKTYVLLWSDNTQVDYREENEPVLQELCSLQNGKYHVVLRKGNHEYPLLRREYTAAKGYFYYFGGELSENYAAGEYVIGYKPGNSLESAVYTVTGNSTVNGLELTENDFRPPTTDLVKLCMDEHTGDTDIHITAAERAAWNAGTGGASYEEATTTASGLMSASDKAKLNGIATSIKNGTGGSSLQGGLNCTASGLAAVALGIASEARGRYSFAAGGTAKAIGDGSSAIGYYVDASGIGQAVVGKYNKVCEGPANWSATEGTQFIVGVGTSNDARANAFRVTTDGYCRGQNAFSGSGADYAEYFEWADGNPNGEDRRGYFVTLEGRKIRKATEADAYILGVISTTPAMIGNTYSDLWQGMYVTDIFGKRLTETVEVEAATDPDTGEEIPAHTETRFMLNPEYDPAQPYAGRHERPEWAAVGLVGQLVVIDDGTSVVNGYCKVTDSGTGTQSEERTAYRVMERLDADHIRIFLR